MTQQSPNTMYIALESDIAAAMRLARRVATELGFSDSEISYVATAASELAANLFIHAGGGTFEVRLMESSTGLALVTEDCGPGIANIDLALQEGYSTAGGLGCGLPGVRRLMNTLEIESVPGQRTLIRASKWR